MALEIEIYNSSDRFERALENLKKSDYPKEDIEDITNFVNEMSAHGIKTIRLNKQVYVLRALSRLKNKSFRHCNKNNFNTARKITGQH